jgi:anti-anti-sigma regulatory factor
LAASSKAFSLTVSPDGALLVSGEIDLTVADDFLTAAVSMADPTKEVVLDLSGLTFIDSGGLKAT